jgi:hypothetical protein
MIVSKQAFLNRLGENICMELVRVTLLEEERP